MIDTSLNKELVNTMGPLIKGTRSMASNLLYLSNGLVILQPYVQKTKSYMIINPEYVNPRFNNHYFHVPKFSSALSKFKKTKSECSWVSTDGQPWFRILNPDAEEPCDTYIMKSNEEVAYFLNDEFQRIPGWASERMNMLQDESDALYTPTDPDLPKDMRERRLCELDVDGYLVLISRPFMGDLKNTEAILYRVLDIESSPHGRIFLKFKQKEPIGNIYSFAAFMKVKKEEE